MGGDDEYRHKGLETKCMDIIHEETYMRLENTNRITRPSCHVQRRKAGRIYLRIQIPSVFRIFNAMAAGTEGIGIRLSRDPGPKAI